MCHVPVLIEKPSSAQNAVLFIYLEKNNLSATAAAAPVNNRTTTTSIRLIIGVVGVDVCIDT